MAVLSIGRLVAVKSPIWAKSKCPNSTAVVISLCITGSVFLINSNVLVYLDKTERWVISNTTNASTSLMRDISCQPTSEPFIIFWNHQWPCIVLVLYCLIPGVCLIMCTVMLIKELSVPKRLQEHFMSSLCPSARSVSKMLVTICVFFLVTSFPICIYLIVHPYIFDEKSMRDMARNMLTWAVVAILLYCNNAFNFILYTISDSLFRKELFKILYELRQK